MEDLERLGSAIALPAREANSCRVLSAEDNQVNQQVITRLLEMIGCGVDLAINGRLAVDMALASPYDLVLMDYHMPEMSGAEAAQQIRAATRDGQHVPIVALTASVMEWERLHCLEAGTDDFLGKPVPSGDLKTVLDKWAPAAYPYPADPKKRG